MSFANKVVIVTGSSAGIGAVTAINFSKEKANVVIVGRNEDRLRSVAEKCPNSLIVKADVSIDDDAKRIIERTLETFGKIDVLVNNAGTALTGAILGGGMMETFDAIMKTNLRAVVHLTTLAAPHLIKTKGSIVNISSVGSSLVPHPPTLGDGVSKAAQDHFTQGAALELAPLGVRVNAICPGPVRTDIMDKTDLTTTWDDFEAMTVLGRVSDPDEIADLILYLASDKARGITGSIYILDNGLKLTNTLKY